MEHFYNKIQGWFTFPNFYKQLVEQAKDGYHFVEVGTWKGKSAAYMAVEIINSGKRIKFDCVDTWEGDTSITSSYDEPLLKTPGALYEHFLSNIAPIRYPVNYQVLNPIKYTSEEASKLYEAHSVNCVFIDAAHDYVSAFTDINLWRSKIVPGGVLAGHDASHPPIQQALNELLPGHHCTPEDVWYINL